MLRIVALVGTGLLDKLPTLSNFSFSIWKRGVTVVLTS